MIRLNHQPWQRAAALLCVLALLALFPPAAPGKITVGIAGGDSDDLEGDPIDSNDYGSGGGGGGGHDDIDDSYFVQPVQPRVPGLVLGKWTVLLVPDRSLGVTVYSFVVIERDAAVGEGWNAP